MKKVLEYSLYLPWFIFAGVISILIWSLNKLNHISCWAGKSATNLNNWLEHKADKLDVYFGLN